MRLERHYLRTSLLGCLLMGGLVAPAWGDETETVVARLKTAYLYNIAKFVRWPEGMSTVVLCVAEGDPVGQAAMALAGREIVSGISLSVQLKPGADCQMTYNLPATALQLTASAAPISISDEPGALAQGAMIEFFMVEEKLRFDVNQAKLKTAPYSISSKLLRLARKRR